MQIVEEIRIGWHFSFGLEDILFKKSEKGTDVSWVFQVKYKEAREEALECIRDATAARGNVLIDDQVERAWILLWSKAD